MKTNIEINNKLNDFPKEILKISKTILESVNDENSTEQIKETIRNEISKMVVDNNENY